MGKHGKYRALVRIALLLWVLAAPVWADCRQALALGLDVSGSVDKDEYRLQTDGLAQAFLNPAVVDAFLAIPGATVRVMVFEWAGLSAQRIVIPWVEIDSATDIQLVADRLRSTQRNPMDPATSLGEAMLFGGSLLLQQDDCIRLTLDISGDGKHNAGPRPQILARGPGLGRVTINGLAIGADAPVTGDLRSAEISELVAYFQHEVLRGPGAFVETALGFEDFQAAMTRKLLKEVSVAIVSELN